MFHYTYSLQIPSSLLWYSKFNYSVFFKRLVNTHKVRLKEIDCAMINSLSHNCLLMLLSSCHLYLFSSLTLFTTFHVSTPSPTRTLQCTLICSSLIKWLIDLIMFMKYFSFFSHLHLFFVSYASSAFCLCQGLCERAGVAIKSERTALCYECIARPLERRRSLARREEPLWLLRTKREVLSSFIHLICL